MATTLSSVAPTSIQTATSTPCRPAYSLQIVSAGPEADEAMALRYRVFALERGATVTGRSGHDTDEWDELCEHLIVRDDNSGQVVGTYRILSPAVAHAAGRSYSSGEFDLAALDPIRHDLVEVGRSCVDPAHRNGSVISLLWSGIARYMVLSGHRYLGGCSSIYLDEGHAVAATVVRKVLGKHAGPEELRVIPRRPWRYDDLPDAPSAAIPPLLRGYLRLGSKVLGAPAHDPDFRTADLYVLLDMQDIDPRVVRRFLGVAS